MHPRNLFEIFILQTARQFECELYLRHRAQLSKIPRPPVKVLAWLASRTGWMMKRLLLAFIVGMALHAQRVDSLEGLWQGYDGEWGHVSRQLVALAEAIPADKFGWRPAPGVRSTSEVFMHIALADFYLLSVTGPPMPEALKAESAEKSITAKPEVIGWLKRSLAAVKNAHASATPRRAPAENQSLRQGCDGGRRLSADHCSRK